MSGHSRSGSGCFPLPTQASPGRNGKNFRSGIGSSDLPMRRNEDNSSYGAMGGANPAFSMSQTYLGGPAPSGGGPFSLGSTISLSPFHSPAHMRNNLQGIDSEVLQRARGGAKTQSLGLLADRSSDQSGRLRRQRAGGSRSARDTRTLAAVASGNIALYERDGSLDRDRFVNRLLERDRSLDRERLLERNQLLNHERLFERDRLLNHERFLECERLLNRDQLHNRDQFLIRDLSLDRRHASSLSAFVNDASRYHTIAGHGGKDRGASAERDHMGARSLERGNAEGLHRSRSIDHEYLAEHASDSFYPSPPDPTRQDRARDSLVLDLQSQVAELNRECAVLQEGLDSSKEKLAASAESIKTFWSPELKKERAMRKEEAARQALLVEQLKMAEAENTRHLMAFNQLEQENRSLRELSLSYESGATTDCTDGTAPDVDAWRREKERHAKEARLLRKTVAEMELRIETQKQTLETRDESIRTLMDMVQAKHSASRSSEEERVMSDEARHIKELEQLLEQREGEGGRGGGAREDSRVRVLECELQLAREELLRANEEGTTSEQLAALRQESRLLRERLETSKQELARREGEAGALQTQVDALKKHAEDHERHFIVLRQQTSAKDEHAALLQADVEMLRDRLSERDEAMERKSRQLGVAQGERKRLDGELTGARDQLEARDRKLIALQKKITSLEESVKDKEAELLSLKAKLTSLQADQSSSGTALSDLEELLAEKEKQIEKMKDLRAKADRQHEEEMEEVSGKCASDKVKLETLQSELTEKQQQEVELHEELARLRTDRLTKESHLSRLEISLAEKTEQLAHVQNKLRKLEDQRQDVVTEAVSSAERRLVTLRREQEQLRTELAQASSELDRAQTRLRQGEAEKVDKDRRLKELNDQLEETKRKLNEGQKEGRSRTEVSELEQLEHATAEEASLLKVCCCDGNMQEIEGMIHDKEARIFELEEALRESIKITAQREVVMHQQQMKLDHTERLLESLHEEMVALRKKLDEGAEQLRRTKGLLDDKEDDLRAMRADSRRRLADVYEMKQEAILAAISEKDAHIALLEISPGKKAENAEEVRQLSKEKLRLQQVLKDLTQSRVKLLQKRTPDNDGYTDEQLSPGDKQYFIEWTG